MNSSQSKILGYVLSVGGNPNAGATTAEIIKNTGLSQNAVYTNLRNGVPGLMECATRSPNGSRMYYCTPKSISEIGFTAFSPVVPIGTDATEWLNHPAISKWANDVEINVNRSPASFERLNQIIQGITKPPAQYTVSDTELRGFYIVAGLTLAKIAMEIGD